jgi:hypothetical protein
MYKFLEVKSRVEYNEEDEQKLINDIREYRQIYNRLLEIELEQRENEHTGEPQPDINDLDINNLAICE